MYNGPFKWWVQSVMPLVFDDSLSYYEVLAKLTKYIEGLTGDVEQIEKILATIEGIEDITEFTKFLEIIQTEIGTLGNLSTNDKTSLVNAINEVAQKASQAYVKPSGGIPETDLSQGVRDKLDNGGGSSVSYIINNKTLKTAPNNNSPADLGLGTYSVPEGGIPWNTLSDDVKNRIEAGGGGTGGTKDYTELINKPQINGHTLNAGNNSTESLGIGTYSKPSSGIPESDLSTEVQDKLNTSGGIADSESSFVATKDYEAGELIYINGTLYKTKNKILNGTNLVPGNNIEQTDISAEIESINSKIDSMASGEGLDSWSLVYNITIPNTDSSGVYHNFFEYVSLIGGESYLFIITPTIQQLVYDRPYVIRCIKHDGTVVKTENVIATLEYENQYRFTFTPDETGEYYFSVSLYDGGYSGAGAKLKIELEYTQSQGISELWAQVNGASQIEPRVDALETLVAEHQPELDALNSAIKGVYNIYDSAVWKQGNINRYTGEISTGDNSNYYSVIFPAGSATGVLSCGVERQICVAYYSNGTFLSRTDYSRNIVVDSTHDFRVVIAKTTTEATVPVSEVLNGIDLHSILNLSTLNTRIENTETQMPLSLLNPDLFNTGVINSSGTIMPPTYGTNRAIHTKNIITYKTTLKISPDLQYCMILYENGIFQSRTAFSRGTGKYVLLDAPEYRLVIAQTANYTAGEPYTVSDTLNLVTAYDNYIKYEIENTSEKAAQIDYLSSIYSSFTPNKICHYSVDDTWAILKDLTDNADTYTSIFDNATLAAMLSIHNDTGMCITFNTFNLTNDDQTYSISNVPEKVAFQAEFQANKNWLKFAFHANSTYTDYSTATGISAAYDTFVSAIYKLTGDYDCIDRFTRLGYFGGSLANVLTIKNKEHGITGLLCADATNRASYYLSNVQNDIVQQKGLCIDLDNKIIFLKTITRNLGTPAKTEIENNLCYQKYVELFSHEYDTNWITNCRAMCEWAQDNGYVFAFPSLLFEVKNTF